MNISWNMTESLEELLKLVSEKEGQAIDALTECVNTVNDMAFTQCQSGIKKHSPGKKGQGNALKSLDKKPATLDGNEITAEYGSYEEKNAAGYYHAKYQEYGAFARKHNAVTFVADPWKRPVDAYIKGGMKKTITAILKRRLGI